MKEKRGQFWETLIPWIIAIGVVLIIMFLYFILTGRLNSMGEFFKNWLRFGR